MATASTILIWLSLFAAYAVAAADLAASGTNGTVSAQTSDTRKAMHLKLIAAAAILIAGASGVLLPALGRSFAALSPDGDGFFVIKAFAAGVILATGMVHILPSAFDALTLQCLGNRHGFAYAGFLAMAASVVTMTINSLAAGYYHRAHFQKARRSLAAGEVEHVGHVHVHTHATHGHAHGEITASGVDEAATVTDSSRHRVISQVLELGILVHSVIIGLSLGASINLSTIKSLIAALNFHQFFEGIGLGGCIIQANFRAKAMVTMIALFSLTAPIGIILGIVIASSYEHNSSTAVIIEGCFSSVSAGILIYMSLVDLLAADFNHPRMQTNAKLQLMTHLALLFGAGMMSLLAKWA